MISKISEKHKDFFDQVFEVVKLIPKGRVTSYGAIANYLGTKSGARMVGWAMNASHNRTDIPAHRVVNRAGLLTGKIHFENEHEMERLLAAEGVIVNNNAVVNFAKLFWDPGKELEMN